MSSVPVADDLAVIVCAYTEERWTDIVDAIDSLQTQATPPGEIVLVIDHNEALYERAVAQFTEGVTIVKNTHKNGLSGARNTGIAASSRPILAFLDDDARADQGWVSHIITPYALDRVVGVGGDIHPDWLSGRPKWWPEEFDWVVGCTYKGHAAVMNEHELLEIRNAIGANMSVRRSAFDAVGGFSAGLGRVGKHPVGAEETELYIRIRHWQPDSMVIHMPNASVHHRVPASRGTFNYFRRRCYAEGLSKAIVSHLVGEADKLSSEMDYTLKVLPLGVLRGLLDTVKGDRNGIKRSGAIIAGLGFTIAGYVRGRLSKTKPERILAEVPPAAEGPK
jgi:glycosyltransferase involved in cell wall biosynthesis